MTTFFLLNGHELWGQKTGFASKIWNYYFNDTTSVERPKFLAYPTLAYSPETRWEFGISSVFVY